MSQLIVQIYKLSHTALRTKARVGKENDELLHIVLRVKPLIFLTGIHTRNAFVLFVEQCTLVKSGAVHSGKMQCILVESYEFELIMLLLARYVRSAAVIFNFFR